MSETLRGAPNLEKTEAYFLELTEEQVIDEIPVIFRMLDENKLTKTKELADQLLKFPNEITPHIFDLFESDATAIDMKEWSLDYLVPQLPFFVKIALEDSLQRIAQAPTAQEQSRNLQQKAKNVLDNFI